MKTELLLLSDFSELSRTLYRPTERRSKVDDKEQLHKLWGIGSELVWFFTTSFLFEMLLIESLQIE